MANKNQVIKILKSVQDPEIGIDIYTLGLIYDIGMNNNDINIKMTFTSPMCPYGPQLLEQIKEKLGKIKGVKKVNLEVVFDPPWRPSEELRAMLGV